MLLRIFIKNTFKFLNHWRLFFLYCALIYISLPFGPGLWEKIEHAFGKTGRDLPIYMLGCAFLVIVLWFLSLKKQYLFRGLFMIALSFAIFLIIANNLEFTAEKMHLIEYAMLTVVIYRCIGKQQSITALHFKILAIGFVVGAIDEGIQFFLPGRVCDIRDVILNAASVSLGQMLLFTIKHLC